MRRCPFCEKEIPDDADRCEHCGGVFNETAEIDLDDLNKAFARLTRPTGINLDELNRAFTSLDKTRGITLNDLNRAFTSLDKTAGITLDELNRALTESKKPPESEPDEPVRPAAGFQLRPEVKLAGRYRLICEIGRGGMGVVWLAHDERLDMDVAVKVLPPELARDERGIRVLTNEARLSMQLTHHNIVRLHDFHESDGLAYLVMEFVRGRTLDRHLLKKKKFTVEETLKYAEQICAGLEYAHQKRVIHRDLKPSNLMLTKEGTVKIADFGIARQIRDSMSRVSKDDTSGTLLYMSPEQLMGERLDHRSDIYSLGVVLYELLNGEPPFVTGDVQTQIRFKDPEPIEGIPDVVNNALLRMLAKDPEERPSSAADSLKALRGETEKPTEELPKAAQREGFDDLLKRVAECAKAVADARKYYTPTSAKLHDAESNLKGGLDEVVLRIKALKARYKTMSRDMRPNHPEMKALSAKINSVEQKLLVALSQSGIALDADGYKQLGLAPFLICPADAGTVKNIQEATAAYLDVRARLTSSLGMEFVLIPAGEFMMGSPSSEDRDSDEGPQHRVRITKPFYMGAFEVTQEQYEKVMGKNPAHFKGAKNPVEQVSWHDAVEFCKRLSQRDGVGYRLPTEAEWEYACRAGTTTRFYFGDSDGDLHKHANYADRNTSFSWSDKNHDDGFKETAPVGRFLPNGFGLRDMHGNVWEWCADWYDSGYYKNSPTADPSGPRSGSICVRRGGSWILTVGYCRSANRSGCRPDYRVDYIGFRVICAPRP